MLPEPAPQGHVIFQTPSSSSPDLKEFWELWQREKFWACHESLETVWRREDNAPRRQFLQGLVHLSAAIFQHRRGNAIGCARQMTRARVRLRPFFPVFEGLEVEQMFRAVEMETQDSLCMEHRGLRELEAQVAQKISSPSSERRDFSSETPKKNCV